MKIKRKLSILLTSIMIFITISGLNIVSAEVNSEKYFSQEDYEKGRAEGWIGDDTSLEDMQYLNKETAQLKESLEKNKSFIQVYSTSSNTYRAGDIIITNATSHPIAGHAGIFVGKNSILSIDGPGKHPSVKTFAGFKQAYHGKGKWIQVYRCTKSSYGPAASDWAMKTYHGSKATYEINKDIKSTSKTYCSKIVYQSYLYGVGKNAVRSLDSNLGYVPPIQLGMLVYNCDLKYTYNLTS